MSEANGGGGEADAGWLGDGQMNRVGPPSARWRSMWNHEVGASNNWFKHTSCNYMQTCTLYFGGGDADDGMKMQMKDNTL